MTSWVGVIIAFIFQETVSMTGVLVYLRQQGANVWVIHSLFIVATSLDILIGYAIGKYLHTELLEGSRFDRWVKKHTKFLKTARPEYLLTLGGVVNFPYVNAVIGVWLDLPFRKIFFATLIGDLISYVIFWGLTLGIVHLAINIYVAMLIIVVAVILSMIAMVKYFFVSRV